jgi:16S rRNA (cytosine1402-N4)-methyltransferase
MSEIPPSSGWMHESVMLRECLQYLRLLPGMTVVDGTLGLAGHALAMSREIGPNGQLYGFDWDEAMLQEAARRLKDESVAPYELVHANYRSIPDHVSGVDAILLDLGLSSVHIDTAGRGISFRNEDEPLDMRMDLSRGEPASALLNRWTASQIERVLKDFGDERWAKRIAEKIVERRRDKPIRTVGDFVQCVLAAIPVAAREKRIHPATRSSQALRIAVNGELEELSEAIEDIARCLGSDGRMVVLSYHSGEDRAVKQAFRRLASEGDFEDLTKKPLEPSAEEVQRNSRSRSAKLRAIRRKNGQEGQREDDLG